MENNNLKLWYNKPTKDWNEALPVGNGRLGGRARLKLVLPCLVKIRKIT